MNAVMLACVEDHVDIVKYLVEEQELDISAKNTVCAHQ